MKYYIISGEASGDLHGSNLMKAIKAKDTGAQFRFWGGDKMEAVGGELVVHYRHMAFMGFWEVFTHLFFILKKIKYCKQDILTYQPDAVILIDYPGFNLKIAEFTHHHHLKTFFYISPQVWAWKSSRVNKIKLWIDKLFVILPFEKEFYKTWNYDVEYVGHPLLEIIPPFTSSTKNKIIALLPGSREQEILIKLPLMISVAKHFADYEFKIAKAPSAKAEWYESALQSASKNISFADCSTYELLNQSQAALVTSGTATLETALHGVPQVVCYKGSRLSYEIGKRLVKIKYISLVNLIMDKPVVKELIQTDLTEKNLKYELNEILNNSTARNTMIADYTALRKLLGEGNASKKVAEAIVDYK